MLTNKRIYALLILSFMSFPVSTAFAQQAPCPKADQDYQKQLRDTSTLETIQGGVNQIGQNYQTAIGAQKVTASTIDAVNAELYSVVNTQIPNAKAAAVAPDQAKASALAALKAGKANKKISKSDLQTLVNQANNATQAAVPYDNAVKQSLQNKVGLTGDLVGAKANNKAALAKIAKLLALINKTQKSIDNMTATIAADKQQVLDDTAACNGTGGGG